MFRNLQLRSLLILCLSIAALSGVIAGIIVGMRSNLFNIQEITVMNEDEGSKAPVDLKTLEGLAGISPGRVNLFDLDLAEVEGRLLGHPWIDRAVLEKRLPGRLLVKIRFREPKAVLQDSRGNLFYVDHRGVMFDQFDLRDRWARESERFSHLPVIRVESSDHTERLKKMIEFLKLWEKSELGQITKMLGLDYSTEKGYRALVSYEVPSQRVRSAVNLGQEIDEYLNPIYYFYFKQLGKVFRHLVNKSTLSRHVTVMDRKKIVVKRYPNS